MHCPTPGRPGSAATKNPRGQPRRLFEEETISVAKDLDKFRAAAWDPRPTRLRERRLIDVKSDNHVILHYYRRGRWANSAPSSATSDSRCLVTGHYHHAKHRGEPCSESWAS